MEGRRIIVGVSGSIAAYKAVLLVRLLVRAGAEVRVLMTPAATRFVAPLTFSTLAKSAVLTDVASEAGWNNHVELGLWADAYVIAPATANTLAHLANGLCDTVLAAVYLSARCPVLLAPAMDVDMWRHPSTRANAERLASFGNVLIPVGEGELASGLRGAGRLAEPEDILAAIARTLTEAHASSEDAGDGATSDGAVSDGAAVAARERLRLPSTAQAPGGRLSAKRVLVTAGPTHEPIDPVRFIANRSSGRQGLAIATALLDEGAAVDLVLGPVAIAEAFEALARRHPARLRTHPVRTATEMHEATTALWTDCDAGVLVAAVADYRPAAVAAQKIKKAPGGGEALTLQLVRNPDIAADLGRAKRPHQQLIGFALETEDGLAHARAKLERKGLDAIVLNLHAAEASAFGGDDNEVTVVTAAGEVTRHARMGKAAVGKVVADLVTTASSGTPPPPPAPRP